MINIINHRKTTQYAQHIHILTRLFLARHSFHTLKKKIMFILLTYYASYG